MSNRSLPVLLVLGGLLAAGIGWLGSRTLRPQGEDPPVRPPSPSEPARSATDVAPPGAASPAPATRAPEADGGAEVAVERAAERVRREASTPYESELANGRWIEGRVVFPAGTPPNERVFVVAKGRNFEHGPQHQVEVGGDGRFRVAFSERTKVGWLDLRARYLYLDRRLKLKPRSPPGEIVLEPRLGGTLSGRVVLPEDSPVSADEIVGAQLTLNGRRRTGGSWRRPAARHVEIAEDLTYAFDGLLVEPEYSVSIDPGVLRPARGNHLGVRAGEVRTFDLHLGVGVALAGRVVDEEGEPLAGIEVRASSEARIGWNAGRRRSIETGEDGTFRIRGLTPGKVVVVASARDRVDAIAPLGILDDRDVEDGIELVLRPGSFVAGRVLWPDGTAAGGATIEVENETPRERESEDTDSSVASGRAEADGTFRVGGLSEGPYHVKASGLRSEEVVVKNRLSGKERKRRRKVAWRDAAEHVTAGTESLVLTLDPGLMLAGRVVDDTGAAIPTFRVHAVRLVRSTETREVTRDETARTFRSHDGSFELYGLAPGTWRFHATAEEHYDSDELRLELPEELRRVEFRVPRAATIRGFVRAPTGSPAVGATIDLHPIDRTFSLSYLVSRAIDEERTDASGAFTLTGIPPGRVGLVTSGAGYAKSEQLTVEVEPGETLGGVELWLRAGGTLTGEVPGLDGAPPQEREVKVSGGWNRRTCRTDRNGRFVAKGLLPGEYQVTAEATTQEVRAVVGKDAGHGAFEILERRAKVEIVAGETAHVVLAPPRFRPVRLVGRVVVGGEPLAGAGIRASPRFLEGPLPSTEADRKGRYEILLPGPGIYGIEISNPGGSHYGTSVDVPNVERFTFDVAFGVGSITGRVFGPDGRPLTGAEVQARDSGERTIMGTAWTQTVEDGRYRMNGVPEGTYTLTAWVSRLAFGHEEEWGLAPDRLQGIRITASARVEGIDLHLSVAGAIEGTVRRPDGSPVACMIWASEGTGPVLVHRGIGQSDETGHFRIGGLRPGPLWISAHDLSVMTAKPIQVEIRPNQTAHVELELDLE